jgi:hypothetical protein
MLALPELSAEERACLESGLPDEPVLALAQRICLHLASQGIRAVILEHSALCTTTLFKGRQPVIRIAPELASAWLNLRFGGKPSAYVGKVDTPALTKPLAQLIQHALAETVINLSERTPWPQAMKIQLHMGLLIGAIDIDWNCDEAWYWAQQTIHNAVHRRTAGT